MNNPVMRTDPSGWKAMPVEEWNWYQPEYMAGVASAMGFRAQFGSSGGGWSSLLNDLWNSSGKYGGVWTPENGLMNFNSEGEGLTAFYLYNEYNNSWDHTSGKGKFLNEIRKFANKDLTGSISYAGPDDPDKKKSSWSDFCKNFTTALFLIGQNTTLIGIGTASPFQLVTLRGSIKTVLQEPGMLKLGNYATKVGRVSGALALIPSSVALGRKYYYGEEVKWSEINRFGVSLSNYLMTNWVPVPQIQLAGYITSLIDFGGGFEYGYQISDVHQALSAKMGFFNSAIYINKEIINSLK